MDGTDNTKLGGTVILPEVGQAAAADECVVKVARVVPVTGRFWTWCGRCRGLMTATRK